MTLLANYIQPLTVWFNEHPNLALLITFLISMTESLAIIGSIIPGSVTMTSIGILAGAGIMRVDLTFLAAILGAIAGDSISYLLGFTFSDRLINIWPFSRYPRWLQIGKEYFAQHGGKSVIIGRFIGPLRSIIPLIAGMLGMSKWRFFISNFISAIIWASIYLLPGIILGAISTELSSELAARLLLLVLIFLAGIWLFSLVLKWILMYVSRMLQSGLRNFWSWSRKHPHLIKLFNKITPADEVNYYPTTVIVLILSCTTVFFILLIGLIVQHAWIMGCNKPIFLFLQSLHSASLDKFFIIVAQSVNSMTIISLIVIIGCLTIYWRDWHSLAYWIILSLSTTLVIILLHILIYSPHPAIGYSGHTMIKFRYSFPAVGLSYSTALFTACILFINSYCSAAFLNRGIKLMLVFILFLAGLALLYLGDYWFSDILGAYLCGVTICLWHWIFYRRYPPQISCTYYGPSKLALGLVLITTLVVITNYRHALHAHQTIIEQYVLTNKAWWHQTTPLLPIYKTNRVGNPTAIFNLQYAGSLVKFKQALEQFGWRKLDDSLFHTILNKIKHQSRHLPLLRELHLNQRPKLVMIYTAADGRLTQILRIWRSNYHIDHLKQPLWIGSVHAVGTKSMTAPLTYISPALIEFSQRRVGLVIQTNLPIMVTPTLLLLKEV